MRLVFIILLLICTKQGFGQILLDYSEFNIQFIPKKQNDTLTIKLKGEKGKVCTIYLQDFRGKCDFIVKDKNNKILIKGHYDNALDTSRKYVFAKLRPAPPNEYVYSITERLYFQPLKSGN